MISVTRGGRGSMVLIDEDYFDGWMAALDEMRRPDRQGTWQETTRDIAAGRGRDLDVIAKELGLESSPHDEGRKSDRGTAHAGRAKGRSRPAGHPTGHPLDVD